MTTQLAATARFGVPVLASVMGLLALGSPGCYEGARDQQLAGDTSTSGGDVSSNSTVDPTSGDDGSSASDASGASNPGEPTGSTSQGDSSGVTTSLETSSDPSATGLSSTSNESTGASTEPLEDSTGASTGPLEDSTTGPSGDTTGDSTGAPPSDEVPDNVYCQEVADWNPAWATYEIEVLGLVNERRSQGANCDTKGNFGPTTPLTMDKALRCAARKHSLDMHVRNFLAHVNPDGEGADARITKAGYGSWSTWGENIAWGQVTPAAVVAWWIDSDAHCANIMKPSFQQLGVGYYPGGPYGTLWTQVFAAQ